MRLAEHGGTHLDAPVHFHEGGSTAERVPLERLIAPAVVVDVRARLRERTPTTPSASPTSSASRPRTAASPTARRCSCATGFAARWPDRARYLGTERARRPPPSRSSTSPASTPPPRAGSSRTASSRPSASTPRASTPAARSSSSRTRSCSPPRSPPSRTSRTSTTCPPTGATLIALPMKIAGGSGGPLRAVAILPRGRGSACTRGPRRWLVWLGIPGIAAALAAALRVREPPRGAAPRPRGRTRCAAARAPRPAGPRLVRAPGRALAGSGVLAQFDGRPPPLALFLAALVAGAIAFGTSRFAEPLAHGLPLAGLVGFQAFRLPLELVMHEAARAGVMPSLLSFSGWNFDIATGTLALPVAALVAAGRAPRWLVPAWNTLGLAALTMIAGDRDRHRALRAGLRARPGERVGRLPALRVPARRDGRRGARRARARAPAAASGGAQHLALIGREVAEDAQRALARDVVGGQQRRVGGARRARRRTRAAPSSGDVSALGARRRGSKRSLRRRSTWSSGSPSAERQRSTSSTGLSPARSEMPRTPASATAWMRVRRRRIAPRSGTSSTSVSPSSARGAASRTRSARSGGPSGLGSSRRGARRGRRRGRRRRRSARGRAARPAAAARARARAPARSPRRSRARAAGPGAVTRAGRARARPRDARCRRQQRAGAEPGTRMTPRAATSRSASRRRPSSARLVGGAERRRPRARARRRGSRSPDPSAARSARSWRTPRRRRRRARRGARRCLRRHGPRRAPSSRAGAACRCRPRAPGPVATSAHQSATAGSRRRRVERLEQPLGHDGARGFAAALGLGVREIGARERGIRRLAEQRLELLGMRRRRPPLRGAAPRSARAGRRGCALFALDQAAALEPERERRAEAEAARRSPSTAPGSPAARPASSPPSQSAAERPARREQAARASGRDAEQIDGRAARAHREQAEPARHRRRRAEPGRLASGCSATNTRRAGEPGGEVAPEQQQARPSRPRARAPRPQRRTACRAARSPPPWRNRCPSSAARRGSAGSRPSRACSSGEPPAPSCARSVAARSPQVAHGRSASDSRLHAIIPRC